MGVVYKAYQPSLDRFVAIKVLPAFFAEDERLRARFKREAVTIAQLDHPAILPVYEYGEKGHRSYIVMALAEGGTLAAQVHQPMPVKAVVKLLAPVADALDYAHQHGVLHRDVKPANVLLRRDGRPLLSDFGLARSMDAEPRLTQSGMAPGTPDYMSPELWRGDPAGPASDQYSLAVMCHELMTGRLPFPTSASASNLYRQPDLSQAPESTRTALARALAKSPGDRFPTCSEFVHALLAEEAAVSVPRSGRLVLVAGAAVVLTIIVGGTALAMRGGHPPATATGSTPTRLGVSSGVPHAITIVPGLADLKSPSALALGRDGSLYIADTGNNLVRKVDPAGKVSVVAGGGTLGMVQQVATNATTVALHSPSGVAVDSAGDVFISDTDTNRVVMVDPRGGLRVYAGDGTAGSSGDDGPATAAELSAPSGLTFQPPVGPDTGLGSSLWIIDRGNNKLRQVLPDQTIFSPVTELGKGGVFDPKLGSSGGIAFVPDSNGAWWYLSSANANQLFGRVRGDIPISRDCELFHCMAVFAGTEEADYKGDNIDATKATLNHPGGIAVKSNSDVYVADTGNNRVRLVDHSGLITTVVGGGSNRSATTPLEIQLNAPEAVVLAPDGTLYIADTGNNRILKVAP
jgi:protein kinase-like protein/NHL repeat-containing protein